MKRILSALLLAIIFHVALFVMDVGLFIDDIVTVPRVTAVTVSMSYRQPEPVVEKRNLPQKQPKIKPKEKIKIPEKKLVKPLESPELLPVEPPDIPKEPEVASPQEQEENMDVDENEIVAETPDYAELSEDSNDDDVSNMRVVQEAVPIYKKNPPPRYPRVARRRGYQGTVFLSVLVNEKGRVANLWVSESSGYRILDNAAIKAVRNWVFEPGMKGHRTVSMWVNVPVRFQLK